MRMNTRKIVLSALFLAIGIVLPTVTMHVPGIGRMLLPMHIPVLLCGFICGAPYGAIVGSILPICNSVLFGAPPLMPVALAMSIELLFYGMMSGILYRQLKRYKFGIYYSLILTMTIGRIAWGITSYLLFSILGNSFTWIIFLTQAFASAIPGIIIQLIIVPAIVISLRKTDMEVYLYGKREVSDSTFL
ncbi:ECF transporter S component [Lacrimispora amygdalina]|uniref:ECF transporter S component n=1 Tax=Lacrimispora amygdalina TaxID=253257 RepID=UPI000BE3AAD1|nr:ECF transporter S component [Lacrimispora amygdalina]